MTFTVEASERYDLGKFVHCGSVAGGDLPDKGGIPKVTVRWGSQLARYGSATYKPAPDAKGTTATDEDGLAQATFTPYDEAAPGTGSVRLAKGTQTANVAIFETFNNVAGILMHSPAPRPPTSSGRSRITARDGGSTPRRSSRRRTCRA